MGDAYFHHPVGGLYLIEPKGEHHNAQAGLTQVIDDVAGRSMVNRFNLDAQQPGFAGMLVDREHFKHDLTQESRAYGWLFKLENRTDGIYGQIRWTATGRAAVDGGDYRFFSTEYDPEDLQPVGPASVSPRRVRPMRLAGLTLTNVPNNKGGKPITNRGHAAERPCAMPSLDAIVQVVADDTLEYVRQEQARTGRDFTTAWSAVMSDCPALHRIMNRGLGVDSLAALEPGVKAQFAAAYRAAANTCGTWDEAECDPEGGPDGEMASRVRLTQTKLGGLLNEIAVAHPAADFDERWELAKRNAPEHFWAFIAESFAGIRPYHGGRHCVSFFYRNGSRT